MEDTTGEGLLATYPILRFFHYEHLPPHLQDASRQFCQLALNMAATCPRGPETAAGLRKLLEAKDCMVRARVTADDYSAPREAR